MPTNDTTRTENDAVIQVAQEAARAQANATELELGKVYAYPTANGPEVLDLGKDAYLDRLPAPQRKQGNTVVEDVNSFLGYYRKHADADTEVYVQVDQKRITAVLDAHAKDAPRWGGHRLTLQLRTTRAWDEWTALDRRMPSQRDFAEHIETRLLDIVEPEPALMLEMAQSFQAKTTVRFASGTRLASGDTNLTWEESTDATAGAKGQIKIPPTFKIAVKCLELPVADGEDPTVYGIEARLRYRIDRGQLTIGYLLTEPDAVLRDAVLAVVAKIEDSLTVKVLRGTPASA